MFEASIPEVSSNLLLRLEEVKKASQELCLQKDDNRKRALISMAESLDHYKKHIIEANLVDLKNAESSGLTSSLISRLKLDDSKLNDAIDGVRQVAELDDPLGVIDLERELSPGLILKRITTPVGVLGIIFESRPDAMIQIASLAIRSGNGALLKGGREAASSNKIIMEALQEGLQNIDMNRNSLCLLTSREESMAILKMDGLIDLIIPRGSNELVSFIQKNTNIPVLGHADGICHVYVDSKADLEMAMKIVIDSKTQYPAACNSLETLLVHKSIAKEFLNKIIPAFSLLNVKLRGDTYCCELGVQELANESDWTTEYLDLILSIKIVDNIDQAIDHINSFSSRHTDAIVTEDNQNSELFLKTVDSSGVFHNCSTRFADGFRYGFGAEVGISTQKLPPRGPVGLEGLVSYKYIINGDGHLVSDFSSGKKVFTHVDK